MCQPSTTRVQNEARYDFYQALSFPRQQSLLTYWIRITSLPNFTKIQTSLESDNTSTKLHHCTNICMLIMTVCLDKISVKICSHCSMSLTKDQKLSLSITNENNMCIKEYPIFIRNLYQLSDSLLKFSFDESSNDSLSNLKQM
jgi:hypothetical protein